MAYVCAKCGKTSKQPDQQGNRCNFCGSRMLNKQRPNIAKEVPTD